MSDDNRFTWEPVALTKWGRLDDPAVRLSATDRCTFNASAVREYSIDDWSRIEIVMDSSKSYIGFRRASGGRGRSLCAVTRGKTYQFTARTIVRELGLHNVTLLLKQSGDVLYAKLPDKEARGER